MAEIQEAEHYTSQQRQSGTKQCINLYFAYISFTSHHINMSKQIFHTLLAIVFDVIYCIPMFVHRAVVEKTTEVEFILHVKEKPL